VCAGGADGAAHRLALVTAEIVDNDDVARLERRNQHLFHIGQETFAFATALGVPWPRACVRTVPSRVGVSCWSWPRSRR
jgi:hypothetical protein